jgi:hypothetical protein
MVNICVNDVIYDTLESFCGEMEGEVFNKDHLLREVEEILPFMSCMPLFA